MDRPPDALLLYQAKAEPALIQGNINTIELNLAKHLGSIIRRHNHRGAYQLILIDFPAPDVPDRVSTQHIPCCRQLGMLAEGGKLPVNQLFRDPDQVRILCIEPGDARQIPIFGSGIGIDQSTFCGQFYQT